MIKHYSITIHGRVQGVGYRYAARDLARSLGVYGFVQNSRYDRTVYIEAQGEETILKHFIEWCKEGPPLARVKTINIEEIPIQEGVSDFHIRH